MPFVNKLSHMVPRAVVEKNPASIGTPQYKEGGLYIWHLCEHGRFYSDSACMQSALCLCSDYR